MFPHFFNKHKEKVLFNSLAIAGAFFFVFVVFSFFKVSSFLFSSSPKTVETSLSDSVIASADTIQLPSLPGQPIKWVKTIKANTLNQGQYLLPLPKAAEKIKITPVPKVSKLKIISKQSTQKLPRVTLGKVKSSNVLTMADRKKLAAGIKNRISSKESLALASSLKNNPSSILNPNALAKLNTKKSGGFFSSFLSFFSSKGNKNNSMLADALDAVDVATTPPSSDSSTPADATPQEGNSDTPPAPSVLLDVTAPAPEVNSPLEESSVSGQREVDNSSTPTTEVIPEPTSTPPAEPAPLNEGNLESTTPTPPVTPLPDVNLNLPTVPATPDVQVEYQTPAPVIAETSTDTGKIVQVSAPDGTETTTPSSADSGSTASPSTTTSDVYTNVLAFTTIPHIYKVGQESKIHIKWTNNGDQNVSFHAYDLDHDGYLDYVEWTVPHLSTQTFEIIFTSKAFELDSGKNIISDIYPQTQTEDGVWATVPAGNYVRVTFNDILDNTKDITIHAKPASQGSASVQIYPVYTDADGNQTEGSLTTSIEGINSENTYRTELTDLATPTDVFDLRVTGVTLDFDYIVDPTAWLTGWAHRKAITISHTNVGSDLSNFPLLVKFTADADLASALSTGNDIRFTDSGGRSTLYYEKESWSGGCGASATGNFWVNVPTVSSSADTTIYVYYGNSGAADGAAPTSVWDSNYKGVWHLNDPTNPLDSTSNDNDGTNNGVTATAGQVGGAGSFNSSYINLGSPSSLHIANGVFEAWIKTSNTADAWQDVLDWSGAYGLWVKAGQFKVYDWAGVGEISSGGSVADNQWHHIAFAKNLNVVNGSFFYIDGVQVGSGVTYSSDTYYRGLKFGVEAGGNGEPFIGLMDDVKISSTARTADWIKFEYHNQGDSGNNLTFANQENNVTWLTGWTDGTGDGKWSTAGNWQDGAVPTSTDIASFDSSASGNVSIDANANVKGINIASGYTGTITQSGSHTVTLGTSGYVQQGGTFVGGSGAITDGGVFTLSAGAFTSTSGILSVAGNFANSGTFTHNSGTITFAGTTAISGSSTNTFKNVIISGSSSLTAPSGNMNVAGNWTNSGTFTANSGTVTLTGTGQSISGDSTFYNLTKSVSSADTLTFGQGSTQTVSNTLTLNGASGNLLSLRSSLTGTQWKINPQGTRTLSYLDVKDSNNTNTTSATATYSTNSLNNTNWSISSGDVYTWNGSASAVWSNASNWTSVAGGVPGVNDAVVINGTYTNAPTLSTATSIGSLTISGATVFTFNVANTTKASPALTVSGDVNISGTANITHTINSTAETYKLTMSVGGDFTLGASATINADGKGYLAGYGPGQSFQGPASYGGLSSGGSGPTYGSIKAPTNLGSGPSYYINGGGAVILTVSGVSSISGSISANSPSNGWGGGSGGSVYITSSSVSGSGSISVGGGNNGGGGGRIAIILTGSGADFSNFTNATVTAYGGTGAVTGNGAAGTVYEETKAQTGGNGTLIIDNGNKAISTTALTDINLTVAGFGLPTGPVIVQNKGVLAIETGATLSPGANTITINANSSIIVNSGGALNITGDTLTGADNTATLELNGGTFTTSDTFTYSNINLWLATASTFSPALFTISSGALFTSDVYHEFTGSVTVASG